MPLLHEKLFERRLLHTGESSTTCLRCRMSAGSAFWEFELDEMESRHVCGNAASALPTPRKPARQEPLEDPATQRRHARRLGRASRLANL